MGEAELLFVPFNRKGKVNPRFSFYSRSLFRRNICQLPKHMLRCFKKCWTITMYRSLPSQLLSEQWCFLAEPMHREHPTHQKKVFQMHSGKTQRDSVVCHFAVLSVHKSNSVTFWACRWQIWETAINCFIWTKKLFKPLLFGCPLVSPHYFLLEGKNEELHKF